MDERFPGRFDADDDEEEDALEALGGDFDDLDDVVDLDDLEEDLEEGDDPALAGIEDFDLPPKRDFRAALERILRAGKAGPRDLAELSDARGDEVEAWRAFWAQMGAPERRSLSTAMAQAAEADYRLFFDRLWVPLMDDDDAQVRMNAIRGTAEVDQPAQAERLLRRVAEDPDPAIQGAAADALGQLFLKAEEHDRWSEALRAALDLLLRLAADEAADEDVRAAALVAAAYSGREEVGGLIQAFAGSGRSDDLITAFRAAANALDHSLDSRILEALDAPSPQERMAGIYGATQLSLTQAVPQLANLAEFDPQVDLRLEAIFGLGEIGDKQAIRALEQIEARLGGEDDPRLEEAVDDALATARLIGQDAVGLGLVGRKGFGGNADEDDELA